MSLRDVPSPSLIGPAGRAAYTAAQAARVAWFFGQYALAARLSGPNIPRAERPRGLTTPSTGAILAELRILLERDLANIRAGYYRMPHDLAPSPLRVMADAAAFFRDLPEVQRRRRGRIGAEVRAIPPPGSENLPPYYRQNFHFQTDGYLSRRSARLYDHQVEVLFGGGADAMRRQALAPLFEYLKERVIADCRLLDVAAGTGRFLTFVKDNWPRLETMALDLSHPYLVEARRTLAPWMRSTRIVQAAAEALPVPDASQDVITCIYLFHELPRKIRAQVAVEWVRVLKPGGIVVFIDSLQTGDKPTMDGLITLFPLAFHEPYYADYSQQDLAELFIRAGLTIRSVSLNFMSKMIVLEKAGKPDSQLTGTG